MFKIEYLSSYNLSFRVGYCVYIEIPLRLSSAPIFGALKKMSAVHDVTFSYVRLTSEYRMT